MALVHEFERTGNWLFRRRSWLPVFLILSGIIVLYLVNRQSIIFDLRDELIFLGVSMLGQAIRIITIGFTPKNTSGRNTTKGQVADELNVTGMYSMLRHPLYVGNYFMWLGPVLFIRSFWFDIIFSLVYWIYYERIMFAEEQYLRRKFGEAYDQWSEKVAAVVPYGLTFVRPKLPFSLRNVLKREYNSFVNIFVVFAILDLVRNYFLSGHIHMTDMWMWVSCSVFVLWFLIRTIHKKTRLLNVQGR